MFKLTMLGSVKVALNVALNGCCINIYFQGGSALMINHDGPIISNSQDTQARKWNVFRRAEKHTPKNIQVISDWEHWVFYFLLHNFRLPFLVLICLNIFIFYVYFKFLLTDILVNIDKAWTSWTSALIHHE